MRLRVKICGVTTTAAVRAAACAGADAVGFVFSESPRRLDVTRAVALAAELPPFVMRVAVFRHPEPARLDEVLTVFRPDVVQSEPDEELLGVLDGRARLLPVLHDSAAVVVRTGNYDAALLEAPGPGGRGIAPDWERAAVLARQLRLVLAGGLTPENVGGAVQRVRPFAVDVSSGVESRPGIKDPRRIARFVASVRRAERALREPGGRPCNGRASSAGLAGPKPRVSEDSGLGEEDP